MQGYKINIGLIVSYIGVLTYPPMVRIIVDHEDLPSVVTPCIRRFAIHLPTSCQHRPLSVGCLRIGHHMALGSILPQ